jgi:hypothetical protein
MLSLSVTIIGRFERSNLLPRASASPHGRGGRRAGCRPFRGLCRQPRPSGRIWSLIHRQRFGAGVTGRASSPCPSYHSSDHDRNGVRRRRFGCAKRAREVAATRSSEGDRAPCDRPRELAVEIRGASPKPLPDDQRRGSRAFNRRRDRSLVQQSTPLSCGVELIANDSAHGVHWKSRPLKIRAC